PSQRARQLAGADGDARRLEVVLGEAERIVRSRPPLVIAATRHGFVCASAAGLRDELERRTGRRVGVVVTDTFGRAWRVGIANVAIGAAGVEVLRDLRGQRDPAGYELHATVIALADEIAAAAELAMGKTERVPVAIV